MRRYIITAAAFLCILTMGGCSRGVGYTDVNPTTATATVSSKDGCEVSEWKETTGGAVKLREWLNGFETEPVGSVPGDGHSYEIELKFGADAPESYEYRDCAGKCYLRQGSEWFGVKNPSPIPIGYVPDLGVDVWDIIKVEYVHCAEIEESKLSDKDKMSLSEWLCGVKYERRQFPAGETPGDSDGGECYWFTFGNGELSYIVNGPDERFLLCGGEWYGILDGSEFPTEI